jgi:hypothetical protein
VLHPFAALGMSGLRFLGEKPWAVTHTKQRMSGSLDLGSLPRQSLGFLPSGGQYTSKAPRKSVSGQGATGASCALSGNLWY